MLGGYQKALTISGRALNGGHRVHGDLKLSMVVQGAIMHLIG